MIERLSRWLAPTVEDPQKAQQQYILNLVLLGLAISGFLFGGLALILWILGWTTITGAIVALFVQPFYLLAFWLSRRGHVRLASYFPVIALFLASLAGNFQVGIGHATIIGYAMATLSVGILFGYRTGLLVAALSMAATLLSGYAQANGAIPNALSPQTTIIPDAVALGLGISVIVILTRLNNNPIAHTLEEEQSITDRLEAQRKELESQVAARQQDIERRLVQIRTAADISRFISAVLDPQVLIQQVVDLIQQRFSLYYVGLFLLDERGEYAFLRAGTGEEGKTMIKEGHKLVVGGASMIGWATSQRQPRIALDVGQEAVRFSNPHLPLTRSEMALPLLSGERVLGALTIQSAQPEAFDQDDITILQGISDSLATALENARLFQQVQTNLDEIRTLHRHYLSQVWAEEAQLPEELSYTFESGELSSSNDQGLILDLPITLREQVIGRLTLEGDKTPWAPEEVAFIEAVTTETAVALENARLLDETRRLVERERLLADISSKVRATPDVNIVLRTAILEIGKALRASSGLIQLDPIPTEDGGTNGGHGDED